LDAESEKTVQEALDRLMQGRTAIIIAHRLSTIVQADCIFVLEKGQVQEQGRHEQLLQTPNGLYHQLAKLQLVSN
jgi:subfamily B ATP-binding cassette protein MsbA